MFSKVIEFLTKSSTSKIFVVGGFLLILIGVFGQQHIQGYKIGPEGAWRYVAFVCGVILLGVTSIQFSLMRLRTWLVKEFVVAAKAEISKHTADVAKAACEEIGEHNETLLTKASVVLDNRTKSLETAERHLVDHVEDATRRVLKGIPKIFHRAYTMIQAADEEIWMVNFALEFGKIHTVNREVVDEYANRFDRDFSEDVKDFYRCLKMKAQEVPTVNILTISKEGAMTKFLIPFVQRDGYRDLPIDDLLDDMERAKRLFTTTLAEARRESTDSRQYRCFELPSIPIQMLITGIAPQKGQSDKRYGCLVFMVGSESLPGLESGQESGIYTELKDMVIVMKNLGSALMRGATVLYDEKADQATGKIRRIK